MTKTEHSTATTTKADVRVYVYNMTWIYHTCSKPINQCRLFSVRAERISKTESNKTFLIVSDCMAEGWDPGRNQAHVIPLHYTSTEESRRRKKKSTGKTRQIISDKQAKNRGKKMRRCAKETKRKETTASEVKEKWQRKKKRIRIDPFQS